MLGPSKSISVCSSNPTVEVSEAKQMPISFFPKLRTMATLQPEGAGSGAYAGLPGGDFLTKRYRQQHGEVKKEELLRVKDELRRLEERDFQESPLAPADDWLPASTSEEAAQTLSGGVKTAGWEGGVSVQQVELGGGLASSSGTDAVPKGPSVLEARKASPEFVHVAKGSPRPRSPLGRPPAVIVDSVQGADGTERKPSPSRLGVSLPEKKPSPSSLGTAQPERKPSPSSLGSTQLERKPSPSRSVIAQPERNASPKLPGVTESEKKASPLGVDPTNPKASQPLETAPPERKPSPSPLAPPPPAAPPPPPPPPSEAAPAPPQKAVAVAPPQNDAKKALPQKQASFDEAMRTQMGKAEQERRELAEMFAREKKKVEDQVERTREQVERTRELAGNTYHPTMRKVPAILRFL